MTEPLEHLSERQLADYVLGRLRDPENAQAESHLDICPECERRAVELELTDAFVEHVSMTVNAQKTSPADASALEAPSKVQFVRAADYVLASDPPALEKLRGYRLLGLLGSGPHSSVWLAESVSLRRKVAIRWTPSRPNDQEGVALGVEAAQAAIRVRHPNLGAILAVEKSVEPAVVVMEYVEGTTLENWVDAAGRLSAPEACRIIYESALGLAHAHSAGVIHGAIKPSNIALSHSGQTKVMDLGRGLPPTPDASFTAPEFFKNPPLMNARSDIFSLGCTLYYLLEGQAPRSAPVKQLDALRKWTPFRPLTNVNEELAKLVDKMMAPYPADRFESMDAVALALAPFSGQPLGSRPARAPGRRGVLSRAGFLAIAGIVIAAYVGYRLLIGVLGKMIGSLGQ